MRVPDDVFAQICAEMTATEQSGELDQLFKAEPRAPDLQTGREPLMRSLRPDVKLYKSTFKKILGYDITTPGFAEDALTRLEILGCSRAREYYEAVKAEWQQEHDAQMKGVAHWYKGQCENEFDNMKRKAVRARDWKIENLTREELTELCQSLLRDGIISEPEQFSAAVSSILEKTSRA